MLFFYSFKYLSTLIICDVFIWFYIIHYMNFLFLFKSSFVKNKYIQQLLYTNKFTLIFVSCNYKRAHIIIRFLIMTSMSAITIWPLK